MTDVIKLIQSRWCWGFIFLVEIGCCAAFTGHRYVSAGNQINHIDSENVKENQSRAILLTRLSRAFIAMLTDWDDVDIGAYFGVVLAKAELEAVENQEVKMLADVLIKKGPSINYPLGSNLNNIARHILTPSKWMKVDRTSSTNLDCKINENQKLPSNLNFLRYSPNETESDMCLSQLIDAADNEKKLLHEEPFICKMSDECKEILLEGDSWGYALTHRVIYFLVAESQGCTKTSVEELCCSIWKEILELESYGFPLAFRDLFMEQVFVCALSGYSEFLQNSWLQHILDWQRKDGCWGFEDIATKQNKIQGEMKINHGYKIPNAFRNTNNDVDDLNNLMSFIDGSRKGARVTRRRRSTQPLGKKGCSSHMTGIGVALLALAARRDVVITQY